MKGIKSLHRILIILIALKISVFSMELKTSYNNSAFTVRYTGDICQLDLVKDNSLYSTNLIIEHLEYIRILDIDDEGEAEIFLFTKTEPGIIILKIIKNNFVRITIPPIPSDIISKYSGNENWELKEGLILRSFPFYSKNDGIHQPSGKMTLEYRLIDSNLFLVNKYISEPLKNIDASTLKITINSLAVFESGWDAFTAPDLIFHIYADDRQIYQSDVYMDQSVIILNTKVNVNNYSKEKLTFNVFDKDEFSYNDTIGTVILLKPVAGRYDIKLSQNGSTKNTGLISLEFEELINKIKE
jgi:hypothetical protein